MLRTVSRIVPGLFLIVLIGLGIVFARSGQIEGGLMPSTGAQPGAAEAQFGLPTYFGSLEVTRSRAIAPGVNGEVLELLVEVGDLVEEGQQLLRIDSTQLDWSVQRAELALELARVALLEINEQSSESELAVARSQPGTCAVQPCQTGGGRRGRRGDCGGARPRQRRLGPL